MSREVKFMLHIKRITSIGILTGLLLFLSSFFANGINPNLLLSAGIGTFAASIMIFGCSLFMSLMQSLTEKTNRQTTKDSIHSYQP
ncbi:hypothetical protein [Aquibacillus albus]|uniref:Uncharacterized protein n=1 Tax=Aquibacillus albus TaxID=1168171 RepID=A0ABS2MV14_9BACI|nr:hypothetical protein [Aquibacillus albus]MBM7569737.1 hypothetical protein [Aquibacillus albus]